MAHPADPVSTNPYRPWAARFWQGMRFSAWVKLALRNRLHIHPLRWPLALTTSIATGAGSLLAPVQSLLFGRRIARTELRGAPIFIIGHWRSGTTLLHELLVLDERHGFPTTIECFAPTHCLLTGGLIRRLKFLLPARRPMDNMPAGWQRPMEDEFALCNLGLPSPYLTMAFPNHPPTDTDYLDFEGLDARDIRRWKEGFLQFLRLVTYRSRKRIVLKSPPHTGRVRVLMEMFPDARFVHIVRNPYSMFPSTIKLWKSLYKFQAFQLATCEHLEEYVLECFERMYARFEIDRDLLGPDRLFEIRYEDLVSSPVESLRALYEQLELGDFEPLAVKVAEYFRANRDYQTNRLELEPRLKAEIDRRWGPYLHRHGYCLTSAVEKPVG